MPKQPRIASSLPSGASQADAVVLDDDDEDDASQEAPGSTQGYNEQQYRYALYGNLHNKIVGLRFYDGYATTGERVVCRREIQVLNVQNRQIGHLPRTLAAKLAVYMDSRSLLIEAFLTGPKREFDCPIALKLYGTNEPTLREQLVRQMRTDKLPMGHLADRQRKEAKAAKAKERAGVVVGADAGGSRDNGTADDMMGTSQGDGLGPGPSLEDIIDGSVRFHPRNLDRMVEEFGVKEADLAAMPKASQPEALQTKLHPFQLQALQWMLDKETPQLPAQGTKHVVQLWQRHSSIPGPFTNLATNFSVTSPALASGGILAGNAPSKAIPQALVLTNLQDDMGLGKTIETISLIMADRALGRQHPDACGATLILAPVSVMSNWSVQIKTHIKKQYALSVMFWHGQRKETINPQQIKNYDVVISTYESISSDWYSQKSPTVPRKSGPFSVKWRRIVLDEGHNIRNPKAKKTIAITNLLAQSRWSLTGTPIVNNLKDLYSQVRFLRLSGGLDSFEIFHGAIMRPVLAGDPQGNKVLQSLMSSVCLRRKKDMSFIDLRLPPLSEFVHKIKLSAHEQEKYDALEAQAMGTLSIYKHNIGKKDAANTYRHLLEVLLRMRQLCNHWQLVGEERLDSILKQLEAEGTVDLTQENQSALQKLLQLSVESQEDCPICLDSYREAVITKCAHIFCLNCIDRVIETQHKCPMCRAQLDTTASTTVRPAKETSRLPAAPPTPNQPSLPQNTSSKLAALLDLLNASAQDPSNKTIVFSQWTSFLNLLAPHLAAHNLPFTRIDGSMSPTARDSALESFHSNPTTTILLASLAVCSVGLNLVAANQVVLADSWWAPAIEDQAVDRVHRLGQTRETRLFRLVVEGSVEERVLGVQEEKRRLMGLAFAEEEAGARRKRSGLGDLMTVLGARAGAE